LSSTFALVPSVLTGGPINDKKDKGSGVPSNIYLIELSIIGPVRDLLTPDNSSIKYGRDTNGGLSIDRRYALDCRVSSIDNYTRHTIDEETVATLCL
jgi:hypothetical protein